MKLHYAIQNLFQEVGRNKSLLLKKKRWKMQEMQRRRATRILADAIVGPKLEIFKYFKLNLFLEQNHDELQVQNNFRETQWHIYYAVYQSAICTDSRVVKGIVYVSSKL